MTTEHDQPAPRITNRDPWPSGIEVPAAIKRLQALAHDDWEHRIGYSLGSKKLGRGNVGTGTDARWAPHHYVGFQARPAGTSARACVWVTYAAPVTEPGQKIEWKHEVSTTWDTPSMSVADVKELLAERPPTGLFDRINGKTAPPADPFSLE